jgi:hypothetical protein
MFYYCGAVSEKRAARCIVATGVLLERGLPRDVESLHPRACMPRGGDLKPVLPRGGLRGRPRVPWRRRNISVRAPVHQTQRTTPPARAGAGRHHPGVVGEPAAGCIPPNRPKTTPMWPAGANEVRGAGLIRPSTGQRGASRLVEGAVFLVVVQPGSVRDAGSQRTSKQYTEAIRH